jgi:hypothetical protein
MSLPPMGNGNGNDTHDDTHTEDRDHPSEPEVDRGQLIWDAAQQNSGTDNREAAGINLGTLPVRGSPSPPLACP